VEVVSRLKNPPRDPRAPAYQEALSHVTRYEDLGRNLANTQDLDGPEQLLRKVFPGIEKTRYYERMYGSTETSPSS
jgi:hypothetical protein